MMIKVNRILWLLMALSLVGSFLHAETGSKTGIQTAPISEKIPSEINQLQVFYKEKPPSQQTLEKVKTFLEPYKTNYSIQYLLITDPKNEPLIHSLKLPTDHFPFAIAINGKTSATIDGKTVIFAHFPDFMHHVGRHPGNWTLDDLKKALENPALLLKENPAVQTEPEGPLP